MREKVFIILPKKILWHSTQNREACECFESEQYAWVMVSVTHNHPLENELLRGGR